MATAFRNSLYRLKALAGTVFAVIMLLISIMSYAQNRDLQWVIDVNNAPGNYQLSKLVTNTTLPLAIGAPIVEFTIGMAHKNKEQQWHAAQHLVAGGAAGFSALLIKHITNRPRPYEASAIVVPYELRTSSSMPSAHTSVAFAMAASYTITYKHWYIAVPAYMWAGGVGYSRIRLGVHYPTDVLMGAAVGVGSAYVSHYATNWLCSKYKQARRKQNLQMQQ